MFKQKDWLVQIPVIKNNFIRNYETSFLDVRDVKLFKTICIPNPSGQNGS